VNGGGHTEAAVASERPLLLAEHVEAATGYNYNLFSLFAFILIYDTQKSCALLLRLGHDCCSFAATAAATWATVGGGRRLVFRLESTARARDCVECVAGAARAHFLDARVLKDGRLQAAVRPLDALRAHTLQVYSNIHHNVYILKN